MAARRRPRTGQARAKGAPLTQQDLAKSLGLRQFREKAGLTQQELASQLGVSQATLSAYEGAKAAVPDDIFESLLEIARAHATGEGGNPAAGDSGDAPLPGPGDYVPPAEDSPPIPSTGDVMGGLSAAMLKDLSANQKRMAKDLEAMYQLLATVVGRFSDEAGGVLYGDSEILAQSAVAAAEESAMIAKLVAMLSQGPVFSFAMLHALTAMKIEAAIREKRRQERELRQFQAQNQQPPAPPVAVPMPPSMSEAIDPLEHYRTAAA
jgi:DNA-binding transcriptional regulator YiaG